MEKFYDEDYKNKWTEIIEKWLSESNDILVENFEQITQTIENLMFSYNEVDLMG